MSDLTNNGFINDIQKEDFEETLDRKLKQSMQSLEENVVELHTSMNELKSLRMMARIDSALDDFFKENA